MGFPLGQTAPHVGTPDVRACVMHGAHVTKSWQLSVPSCCDVEALFERVGMMRVRPIPSLSGEVRSDSEAVVSDFEAVKCCYALTTSN